MTDHTHRQHATSLPHPITFFTDAETRRNVIRALKQLHDDRTRALLIALHINPPENDDDPTD